MNLEERVNTIDEGKIYKFGVLQDFIIQNNYVLISTTIPPQTIDAFNEERKCIVNKVISTEQKLSCSKNNSFVISNYNGIIFSELV